MSTVIPVVPKIVDNRPSIVVILGAGSSADFGVPTLRSIFKNAEAAAYLRRDTTLQTWLQRVFWEPRGYSAANSDRSLTIEEMLTIIRDWQGEDKDAADLKDVDDIRRRLYVLIYHAVYFNKSSSKAHLNGLIDTLRLSFKQITWASFNWDCIFESSYWYNSGTPQPGTRSNPHLVIRLAGWHDPGFARNTYLKLHGSVNWWLVNGTPTYLRWASYGDLAEKWKQLEREETADRPIILEPSAYKYEDPIYQSLKPQWEEFSKRLGEADCVLVLGYSLPDNDPQSRCKILTSFQVNQGCRWAVVDPGTEARAKYERLLGSQRLVTFDQSLAGFGANLEDNLRGAFPNVEIKTKPAPPVPTPAPPGPM
jgi:NAD-dependent SIR2 family protein deacetylase